MCVFRCLCVCVTRVYVLGVYVCDGGTGISSRAGCVGGHTDRCQGGVQRAWLNQKLGAEASRIEWRRSAVTDQPPGRRAGGQAKGSAKGRCETQRGQRKSSRGVDGVGQALGTVANGALQLLQRNSVSWTSLCAGHLPSSYQHCHIQSAPASRYRTLTPIFSGHTR